MRSPLATTMTASSTYLFQSSTSMAPRRLYEAKRCDRRSALRPDNAGSHKDSMLGKLQAWRHASCGDDRTIDRTITTSITICFEIQSQKMLYG